MRESITLQEHHIEKSAELINECLVLGTNCFGREKLKLTDNDESIAIILFKHYTYCYRPDLDVKEVKANDNHGEPCDIIVLSNITMV